MNARTFGTDDHQAGFFARYGVTSYEQAGRAIAEAQRQQDSAPQVPNTPATAVRLASEKAVNFLADLWMERSDKATREQVVAWASQQDRAIVSEKIDWLKTQPKLAVTRTPVPEVPAGRYAVTGEEGQTVFLKVDRPTEGQWKGRTFVKVQAGDEFHPMALPVAKALLAKILADGPKAASIRYGRELGVCGVCGRTLTDETSRAAGIGPKCAGRF
jgi:hypothetical protein